MDNPVNLRLFIAIELPEAIGLAVEAVQQELEAGRPPVKWVSPQACHLTLQFLGTVDSSRVAALLEALREVGRAERPFSLRLKGLGAFPNLRRPRVVWAGLAGDLEALVALQRRVIEATRGLGFVPEARPFSPHLTLGRVREGARGGELARLAESVAGGLFAPEEVWAVSRFALIRSELLPGGARYTALGYFPLGG